MGLEPSRERGYLEAIETFVEQVQIVRPLYDEHLEDNDELLPHVFMADVRRLFVDLVEAGACKDVERLLAAIEVLESSPRDDVRNVVDISFLEDAYLDPRERKALDLAEDRFGPGTRAQYERTKEYHR